MTNYWIRQRLLFTLIISITLSLVVSVLFVSPYISQQATAYNNQSLYKNTSMDFVVPEPSYEQALELPGTNGIDAVFPFFLTKASVSINGKSRTTTILITDQSQQLEHSMYNRKRLIQQADEAYSNPILVDWQFCKETGAKVGDTISLTIGSSSHEYRISAIYESNVLYDGGALLVQVSDEQMLSIRQGSQNNGFSGMYVTANDYDSCRQYLLTDYRPLGRLRARDQFSDDNQYQIHYDAIMSSGYSNEITDFRMRETNLEISVSSLTIWLGLLLTVVAIILFNVLMANRGCEKTYFIKHCIPNGQNVKPYYVISFGAETALCIIIYAVALIVSIKESTAYIPSSAFNLYIYLFPITVLVVEIVCLAIVNRSVYGAKQSGNIDNPDSQQKAEGHVSDSTAEMPESSVSTVIPVSTTTTNAVKEGTTEIATAGNGTTGATGVTRVEGRVNEGADHASGTNDLH